MFSLIEIFDIVVMTLVIGFLFKDYFPRRPKVEVLMPEEYLARRGFNWNDFWFAAAIVAPSIILHEFGHKFVAIGFGMNAVFQAAYTWLAIAAVIKLIGFPFLFFVPAYVTITGAGSALETTLIAFAGPAVNLLLWLGSALVIKTAKLKKDAYHFIFLTSKINMFLFIFNMLPIPGFDGATVFTQLFRALTG